VLALGTLLTLVFNGVDDLFPLDGAELTAATCTGPATAGIFCVLGAGWGRAIAIGVCLAVLSGVVPRWTAIPHWYCAHSVAVTLFTVEGGDQLAAVLSLLLVPVLVTDGRRNHWQPVTADRAARVVPSYIAHSALLVLRIQMAVVYLHASLGKLGVTEWVDGTSLFYWLADPVFGVSTWAAGLFGWLLATPWGVAVLTWGTLVVEFTLALGLFAKWPFRPALLVLGIGLHLSIAVLMGLVTFGLTMVAGLLLYLFRPEDWRGLTAWWRSRRSMHTAPVGISTGGESIRAN